MLVRTISRSIYGRSGAVFYSGRASFTTLCPIYILGLNPGGDPVRHSIFTVGLSIAKFLRRNIATWSAYTDEKWDRRSIQVRMVHLLSALGYNARVVPASNVVFVRTASESSLKAEKDALLRACWPFHSMVIQNLNVRLVLCLGKTAGCWARKQLGANRLVDTFIERYPRLHRTSEVLASGIRVATLVHPARCDWTNPLADPTPMILRSLRLTLRQRIHMRRRRMQP